MAQPLGTASSIPAGQPPLGDVELRRDEIDAVDELRHRVLDLKAGVHFEEVIVLVVEQELDGPHASIARGAHELEGRLRHALAELRRDHRRRSFLDDLLEAPLHRALALAERDAAALPVAEHLELDVARLGHEALDEHGRVAESGGGFLRGPREHLFELRGVVDDAHAASSAAPGGLDQERGVTERGDGVELVGAHRLERRHAELVRELLRVLLVAHPLHRFLFGAAVGDARLLHARRELGVLREEAVAGVDDVGAVLLRGPHDGRAV